MVATAVTIGPRVALAAVPPLATEHLEALHRKTLGDYDSELTRRGATASAEAREQFAKGAAALGGYEFATARAAFAQSSTIVPTYAAKFNEALVGQIERRYSDAQRLYGEAEALEGRDVELQVNLGVAFAAQGEFERGKKALQQALDLAAAGPPGAAVRGRVLLQLALLQYRSEPWQSALQTLRLAEDAFAQAQDERGRAVVAAKRGIVACSHGQRADGEQLLIDAIARLQAVGAVIDEAAARSDIFFSCYIDAENWAKGGPHLTRSADIADRAGHMLQLGRSLNGLGIFNSRQENSDAAIDHYRRALRSFRRAEYGMGQGEAANNLGLVFLKSRQLDQAFESFDQSVRFYRQAGAFRWAFDKALAISETFGSFDDLARQKYFLDIATFLAAEVPQPAAKARLLLSLGRYHLATDLASADDELQLARSIFLALGDDARVKAADQLLRELSGRWTARIIRQAALAVLVIVAAIWLFRRRRSVVALIRGSWRRAGAPGRWLAAEHRRWEHWWTGPEPTRTAEEHDAVLAAETLQRRVIRWFFIATIGGILAFDMAMITIPNLRYVFEIKSEFGRAPMPAAAVKEEFAGLLNQVASSIAVSALVPAFVLALGFGVALFLYDVVDAGVFGALRRYTRPSVSAPDASFRTRLIQSRPKDLRQVVLMLAVATLVVAALAHFATLDMKTAGIGILIFIAVLESMRLLRVVRLVHDLPPAEQPRMFGWLQNASRHQVVSVFLNILVFAYVVMPAFYFAGLAAQAWLIHPLFKRATAEFLALVSLTVKKYGFIALMADPALIFTRLERAYDPNQGAGQLFSELLWPILPYCFVGWAIILVFRLLLPLALSFGGLAGAWKVFRIAVIVGIAGLGFQRLAVWLFHLDEQSTSIWLLLVFVALMFTLCLRQAVQAELEPAIECPDTTCRHANPPGAIYCSKCRTKLA